MSNENRPDPEKIQKEIEEMMKERFGDNIKVVAGQFSQDDPFAAMGNFNPSFDETVEPEIEEYNFDFNYTPKQIKTYLDQFVIKQDEAKKALAIAVCDHYNRIRESKLGTIFPEYTKQNILMLGPTGVGKTYLVKQLAKLIGVPFLKADATRFTETGYVGSNVDDMVRDLVSMADGNIEAAQHGIIYFDEADKIAGASNHNGKDISGRGVQYGLLKLMEETEIDLKAAHDLVSQFQSLMDFQKSGKAKRRVINTKNILFIVSGAFVGLEDIIRKRMKLRSIGLNRDDVKFQTQDVILNQVTTKDLIDFGLEPEFVGRLPVRLQCETLSEDDLYQILKTSQGSIFQQYRADFKAYGIEMSVDDLALRAIANAAFLEKTGARGLMTVCEKLFRDFKYELPELKIKKFKVTKKIVENPSKELQKILKLAGKI